VPVLARHVCTILVLSLLQCESQNSAVFNRFRNLLARVKHHWLAANGGEFFRSRK
jgi:hypothetical protein